MWAKFLVNSHCGFILNNFFPSTGYPREQCFNHKKNLPYGRLSRFVWCLIGVTAVFSKCQAHCRDWATGGQAPRGPIPEQLWERRNWTVVSWEVIHPLTPTRHKHLSPAKSLPKSKDLIEPVLGFFYHPDNEQPPY